LGERSQTFREMVPVKDGTVLEEGSHAPNISFCTGCDGFSEDMSAQKTIQRTHGDARDSPRYATLRPCASVAARVATLVHLACRRAANAKRPPLPEPGGHEGIWAPVEGLYVDLVGELVDAADAAGPKLVHRGQRDSRSPVSTPRIRSRKSSSAISSASRIVPTTPTVRCGLPRPRRSAWQVPGRRGATGGLRPTCKCIPQRVAPFEVRARSRARTVFRVPSE
jgi:hypothetical protein